MKDFSPSGRDVAFVTGAGGFLGGSTAAALARMGWTVAALGHGAVETTCDFAIDADISRDMLVAAAEALGRPRLIVHAAGGASVGASLADPDWDRARTVGSLAETLAFLKAEAPDARLVYPSSAAVYGAEATGPIPETALLRPISPYGQHKLQAEEMILRAGVDAVVIRFFSAYGPGLRKQLLWDLARRLASNPEEVILFGTGEEARDFLFVDDAVGLVGLAAAAPSGKGPLIVNGGAGQAVTVREIAENLCRAQGVRTRVRFGGEVKPGDPRSLVADPARARALGFAPTISLAEGLGRYAAWLKTARG